jgi:hypothetical protein
MTIALTIFVSVFFSYLMSYAWFMHTLDKTELLLKQKHDHAFVIEQSQERADFYAELITLLREIRKL